jgi:hypothetical protein
MEDSSTGNCHSLTNICNIPFFLPCRKRLGDVMVSTNDITQINNKNLMG